MTLKTSNTHTSFIDDDPSHLFEMVFNQQFQFMAILSSEGRVLEVNDLALTMQGVKREDYIGKFFWESPAWANLPEWKGIWQKRLYKASCQRDPVRTEDIYQISDGSIRYADASTTGLYQSDTGTLVGYIIQATDVTEKRLAEQKACENQKRLNFILEQSLTGSWDLNLKNQTAYRSLQHDKIFGYDTLLPEWTYDKFLNHVLPEDREDVDQKFQLSIKNKSNWDFECRIKRQDGEIRWIWGSGSHKLDASGEIAQMLGIVQDITKRKQFEAEKLHYAAELKSLFESLPDIYFRLASDGTILDFQAHNQGDLYTKSDLFLGRKMQEVLPPDVGHLFLKKIEDINHTRTMITFTYSLEVNNQLRHFDARLNQMSIDNQLVCVVRDITEIKTSEEELQHLAHHDPLTGLPNRLLLNEYLNQSIKRAKRHQHMVAVLFFDLDNFKIINDSFGHDVGDLLLKETAERLVKSVRSEDSVSRISGDEFIILMEGLSNPDDLISSTNKLLHQFQKEFLLENHTVSVTASIGISLYPQDAQSSAKLLRNADAAMYRAKNDGRNNYQFYKKEMTHSALEHIFLETSLHHAIEGHEFHLHYQPQLRLKDKTIIGVEVLLRWEHPTEGNISPDKFIPLAEESNLIITIGEWVLRHACIQAKQWADYGIEFGRIAVNIAGPQIKRGKLVETVKNILTETGLPASRLELEVTEGYIMQQADKAIEQLNEIKQLGVMLSIDDFGTGYSSLSYLKKLPIHKLKIDQSFIRDIPSDPDDMAISKAVIALGSSLGLTVIAEGVETEEQANYLIQVGCDEVQGFLYSHPIDKHAIEAFISNQTND